MAASNLAQVKAQHARIYRALLNGVDAAVREAGAYAVDAANADPGFTSHTYKTLQSVFWLKKAGRHDMGFKFGATSQTALWMEEGTKWHFIQGRPLLRFWWAREGRMFQGPNPGTDTNWVEHPGTKPTRFLQKAAAKARLLLEQRLRSAAEKATHA